MPFFWNLTKIVKNFSLVSLFFLFVFKMPITSLLIFYLFAYTEPDDTHVNLTYDECFENILNMYGVSSKTIIDALQKDKEINVKVNQDSSNPGNIEYSQNILKKTINDAGEDKEYDVDNEFQQPDFGLTQDIDFLQEIALNEFTYTTYLSAPDLTDYDKKFLLKNYIFDVLHDRIEKTDWDTPVLDPYFITASIKRNKKTNIKINKEITI